jgi:hypothetical protein
MRNREAQGGSGSEEKPMAESTGFKKSMRKSPVGVGTFMAKQGILVAFALFMIGFTIANERFIDPTTSSAWSGPRPSSASWRWV